MDQQLMQHDTEELSKQAQQAVSSVLLTWAWRALLMLLHTAHAH